MLGFYDRLCSMPEAEATRTVAGLSDDFVADFWSWNDREAAATLQDAAGEERSEIIDCLRAMLASDVVDEIRFRIGGRA